MVSNWNSVYSEWFLYKISNFSKTQNFLSFVLYEILKLVSKQFVRTWFWYCVCMCTCKHVLNCVFLLLIWKILQLYLYLLLSTLFFLGISSCLISQLSNDWILVIIYEAWMQVWDMGTGTAWYRYVDTTNSKK